jgi:hypothetical protein
MEGTHQHAAGALDRVGDHGRLVTGGGKRLVLVDRDAALKGGNGDAGFGLGPLSPAGG